MRWENEGGAVSLRPERQERASSRVQGEMIAKESADQPAEGRQAIGDGGARDDKAPGSGIAFGLGQREILPFELLA
jgi:hypothetical protein